MPPPFSDSTVFFFKPSKRQRGQTEKNAKNQKPADIRKRSPIFTNCWLTDI